MTLTEVVHDQEVVEGLHLVEGGGRRQGDGVLVLIGEGRVELIDVDGLALGVEVEEDRLIVHIGQQDLVQLLSGGQLRSCCPHIETLWHSILHVFVVNVRGKWEFLGAALLKEAESSLAETRPRWIILDI